NLYNEINFNVRADWPDNATAIRRTIDGFVCPSNRRPTSVATQTGSNPTSQLGPSDYRGNMAAGFISAPNANCPNLSDPTAAAQNVYCIMFDHGMTDPNPT